MRLEGAQESFARRAWAEAHRLYSRLDESIDLAGEDMERLAVAAYLIGHEAEFQRAMERAHRRHLEEDSPSRACRCAFWLALTLLLRGEPGQASGWLNRARRLAMGEDCVEQGYLLLPEAEQQLAGGHTEQAMASATRAVEIGVRFADRDLTACALHVQGRANVQAGDFQRGLALLDEAMIAVTGGELSPMVTGLLYCSVIDACRQVFALGRAREWTEALSNWCGRQPELVAFTGKCQVHRAEVLQLRGDWVEAMEEANRACQPHRREGDTKPPAAAFYRRGEIHRLRGELAAADEAYREANRRGREPQPGLALLWAAQGKAETALATLRRLLSTATDPLRRARLLPALVEIAVDAGEVREARSAADELQAIAARFPSDVLNAIAGQASGRVALADGDPQAALETLRASVAGWRKCNAPYEIARARLLVGLACRELGDAKSAELEFDAARAAFEELGAQTDLSRLDALSGRANESPPEKLTPREFQVLRRVAEGKTNKAIAGELQVSERTIDRHVSNILTKLGVGSRTAATAYAYRNRIL